MRETLWWNKTPLCAQWLEYPNLHAFWQWKTAHRGKAWLRTQSLRKCIQTKQGALRTTVNHMPNKAISWNEQLGKPSEKATATWWQNTKARRHRRVSTFGQKPWHRLTMQQRAQQNTYLCSRLSRMRTDREAQGNTEGPWGGEFLCNFGHRWEIDKINKQRKELDPSIPSSLLLR